MSRVPTYMSRQVLLSRMQDVQSRLYESHTQVNTGKKSQTYACIAEDSFRLINLENQRERLHRQTSDNAVAKLRLDTMQNSIDASQKSLQEYKALLLDFSARDYTTMSSEDLRALDDIREQSFTAMKDLQYYLNVSIDGRYLFGGGRTDREPVTLPWGNASEFADVFDGTAVTYPETRASDLADAAFGGRTITPSNKTIGTTPYGVIADTSGVTAQTFTTGVVSSLGTLTLNPTLTGTSSKGSIVSDTAGAFAGLSAGMTFLLDDANAVENTGGTAVTDRQSGVYTITDISRDGKTITVVPPPPGTGGTAARIPNTAPAALRLTVPEGSRITITNSAGQDADYTVHWPTNADLSAAGYDLTTDLMDGKRLFVTPPFDTVGAGYGIAQDNVNIVSSSYYKGDSLYLTHRVDDTRSVELGVNALDPAFEKAIRGLGIMAQGVKMDPANPSQVDGEELRRRVDQALDLVRDALRHAPASEEQASDIVSLGYQISSNQKTLVNAMEDATTFQVFLENRISDMENVDMLEAVTHMNDDARALEVSYSALARIHDLSLANYL